MLLQPLIGYTKEKAGDEPTLWIPANRGPGHDVAFRQKLLVLVVVWDEL